MAPFNYYFPFLEVPLWELLEEDGFVSETVLPTEGFTPFAGLVTDCLEPVFEEGLLLLCAGLLLCVCAGLLLPCVGLLLLCTGLLLLEAGRF